MNRREVVRNADDLVGSGGALFQVCARRVSDCLLGLAVDHAVAVDAARADISNELALLVAERVGWTGQCHARGDHARGDHGTRGSGDDCAELFAAYGE